MNISPGIIGLSPRASRRGTVEWPQVDDLNPQPPPPHEVEHHYAPLGFVSWSGEEWQIRGCRCDFEPRSSCFKADALRSRVTKSDAPIKITPAVVAPPIAPTKATTEAVATAPPKRATVRKKTPKARKRQAGKGPAYRLKARLHESKQFTTLLVKGLETLVIVARVSACRGVNATASFLDCRSD